jgi:hypothetical protein
MNFLHYAILMFAICSTILVGVSLGTRAPERRRLAGLTFSTIAEKLELSQVVPLQRRPSYEPAAKTRRINIVFSLLLFSTVVGLWIYFR